MSLAIISGATGDIGSDVGKAFWRAGYSLLCLGRTDAKVGEMRQWFVDRPRPHQQAHVLRLDVTQETEYWRLHAILEHQQEPVTALALCHGAAPYPGKAEYGDTLRHAQGVMDTDVFGTYRLCQAVWKYMQRGGGGSISIVSSLHARATYPHRTPYALAKSALSGLVHALALDWGKDNIRVNSILAWQVEGSRTAQVARSEGEDTVDLYRKKSPLSRLVDPVDVARTVLWLAECASVTGTEIVVDCGVSASMWHRPFGEH